MTGLLFAVSGVMLLSTFVWFLVRTVRRAARGITLLEQAVPLLGAAVVAFRDVPDVFAVVKEIVIQVRNNSGSTILDRVEQQARAATANAEAVAAVAAAVGAVASAVAELQGRDGEARIHLDMVAGKLDAMLLALAATAGARGPETHV